VTTAARERKTITLEAAQVVVEAGLAKATEKGIPFCLVVVDESAQMVLFARQDGCALAAHKRARLKAETAAKFGQPTSGFWDFVKDDPILTSGLAGDHETLVMPGAIPLKVGDEVVGAVGASGAHYSVDQEVVEAAAAAFPA
jgi:uncharacterized protein GlcG (DUF336 family)